jgi:3D (Asp-Asp-Asp) domain-containing protein
VVAQGATTAAAGESGAAGAALLVGCALAVLAVVVIPAATTALIAGAIAGSDCASADAADPAAASVGNLGAVAGTGITRAELATVRARGGGAAMTTGAFRATSYGPPWGGIQGAGIATASGLRIDGGAPRKYFVAVDPALISLGQWIAVWPNPFGWRGAFLAADTGSAIRGRRIDFYDWRGRRFQRRWNTRVEVTRPPFSVGAAIPAEPGDSAASVQAPPVSEQSPVALTAAACAEAPAGSGDAQAVLDAAQALAAMRIPYNYGGGHITPARPTAGSDGPFDGLDCSSAVSWVLQHAGIDVATMTSGAFMSWGEPGPGAEVTLYANPGHIFMSIRSGDELLFFGTNGGRGPQFFPAPSAAYIAGFVQRHPPGL